MSETNSVKLMSVKNAAQIFGMSEWAIYQAIKNDPAFPVVNIGPIKNYRIPEGRLRYWLQKRPTQVARKGVFIPTGQDLLEELGL